MTSLPGPAGGDRDRAAPWRSSAATPRVRPAAIRTVLAANADPDTLWRYDAEVTRAQVRERYGV